PLKSLAWWLCPQSWGRWRWCPHREQFKAFWPDTPHPVWYSARGLLLGEFGDSGCSFSAPNLPGGVSSLQCIG
uniref:Uncharacterized protein n=1 Tax=Calidris pygmaea TaxID=425635 RepID=A0A8C3PN95_9CHAR